MIHLPVLLEEALDQLAIDPQGIYIDATFGRGGHSQAILQRLNKKGRLIVIDKDPAAIRYAKENLGKDERVRIYHAPYERLEEIVQAEQVYGKVNGLLLDLGVSSPQLEEAERGFSFLRNGPLDMRMNPAQGMSAAKWLAQVKEKELMQVLKDYGEERFAKRIARAIVAAREQEAITTTHQLAEIVKTAHPRWEKHKHPATQTFQAIRIWLNNELNELSSCLRQSLHVLAIGGRLVVISFHSLEDRLVKRFIREQSQEPRELKRLPVLPTQWKPRLKSLGRGIKPNAQAIAVNPRSRSARLRVAEKLR